MNGSGAILTSRERETFQLYIVYAMLVLTNTVSKSDYGLI